MNTSSSAIADALVTMLGSASVLGTNTVSKSGYELLESAASSATVIKWRNFTSRPSNFGGNSYSDTWEFEIKTFIRDYGDPHLALNRVWSATDKVITCLKSDYTIQGTCDDVVRITGNYDPESLLVVGGATWLPFSIYLTAEGL